MTQCQTQTEIAELDFDCYLPDSESREAPTEEGRNLWSVFIFSIVQYYYFFLNLDDFNEMSTASAGKSAGIFTIYLAF